MHFPDPRTGEMTEIDTTLVAGPDGRLETKATPVEVSVDPDPRSRELVEVRDPLTGSTVSFGFAAAPASASATAAEDALRLEGIAPGVEATFEPTGSGVKETLTLAGRRSATSFAYHLDTGALEPRVAPDGSIALVGPDGARSPLVVPRGFMRDARGALSDGVTYTLAPDPAGAWSLRVSLDRAWLAAPQRAFPVVVDPMLGILDSADTTITEGSGADQSSDPTLRVGFDGARNRALTYLTGTIHHPDSTSEVFNPLGIDLEVLWAGMAFESHDCEADPGDFELRALEGTWAPGSVTWASSPSLGARVDTGAATQITDATCADGRIAWGYDISTYAQGVLDLATPYEGIALVATDEYATPAVELTAADPAEPTTTGGIIQLFYRDASAGGQPSAPVGLEPTGAIDTLTPTLVGQLRVCRHRARLRAVPHPRRHRHHDRPGGRRSRGRPR